MQYLRTLRRPGSFTVHRLHPLHALGGAGGNSASPLNGPVRPTANHDDEGDDAHDELSDAEVRARAECLR